MYSTFRDIDISTLHNFYIQKDFAFYLKTSNMKISQSFIKLNTYRARTVLQNILLEFLGPELVTHPFLIIGFYVLGAPLIGKATKILLTENRNFVPL